VSSSELSGEIPNLSSELSEALTTRVVAVNASIATKSPNREIRAIRENPKKHSETAIV
jgi:hypothetical protein